MGALIAAQPEVNKYRVNLGNTGVVKTKPSPGFNKNLTFLHFLQKKQEIGLEIGKHCDLSSRNSVVISHLLVNLGPFVSVGEVCRVSRSQEIP